MMRRNSLIPRMKALPAPTLLINGSVSSLVVGWQPVDAAQSSRPHYQLRLSMLRPGGLPPLQVTKQLPENQHSFLWHDLAPDVRYCFRLGLNLHPGTFMAAGLASDETCYSSHGCNTSGTTNSSPVTNGSSCTSCMLWGAAFGAVIALISCVFCMRTGLHSVFTHQLTVIKRSREGHRVGSAYSYLTTNEIAAELEPRFSRVIPCQAETYSSMASQVDAGRSPSTSSPGMSFSHTPLDHFGMLSLLEPYPKIEAYAFEQKWIRCERHGFIVGALLPRVSLRTSEVAELALAHSGLICIAAGVVDQMHRSYFAAQLRGSSKWFMLELLVFIDSGVVQGTFRGESDRWLQVLVDHFTVVLNQALEAQFEFESKS